MGSLILPAGNNTALLFLPIFFINEFSLQYLGIIMTDTNGTPEFDTLELRNRDVTETLSPVADLEQDKKKEFDELELRNRTVTETLSPLEDLGQDKKVEKKEEAPPAEEKNGKAEEEINPDDYDKLELRNRTVTETLSPLEDLGQDPPAKKQ